MKLKIDAKIINDEIDTIYELIYNNYISNNKIKNILSLDKKKINSNLLEYTNKLLKNINKEKLEKILNNNKNIIKIEDIIKKYIIYTFFLFISFYLNDNEFKNMIISLQNLDVKEKIIDNNIITSKIISINEIIIKFKYIINLYNDNKEKFNIEIKNINYKNIIEFIDNYWSFIEAKMKFFYGNSIEVLKNCIKLILINLIYINEDIKDIYLILEDNDNNVYSYIDIIIPIHNVIDPNLITSVLTLEEKNIIYISNNFIELLSDKQSVNTTNPKINKMFENKLFFPLMNDFVRYNKDDITYSDKSEKITKLRYIIEETNNYKNLYNLNDKQKKNIEKNIYKKYFYLNPYIYNEMEEINIIRKLYLQGKRVLYNNPYILDLYEIRKYSFINFNTPGMKIKFNNTISAVRYVNIEHLQYRINHKYLKNLNVRVCSKDEESNVFGLIFTKNYNKLSINNFYNLKDITNSLIDGIEHFLKNDNKSFYWIFDKNDYKNIGNIENFYNINNETDSYKAIFYNIYEYYEKYIYNLIIKKLELLNVKNLHYIYKSISNVQNKYFNIEEYIFNNNLYKKVYYDILNTTNDINDNNISIIHGIKNFIKLPYIKNKKKNKNKVILSNKKIKKINYNIECQHHVDFREYSRYKKKNEMKYSENIYNFIQKYGYLNKLNEYCCRSCHELLKISRNVYNVYSGDGYEGINININSVANLMDDPRYKNIGSVISFIDKLIDKISLVINYSIYFGTESNKIFERRNLTKNILEIIIKNYSIYLANTKKKIKINYNKIYNLSEQFNEFYLFKLDNDIFKYKSNDDDKYKRYKSNNIILYIFFLLIVNLNKYQIYNLAINIIGNYILFQKYGFKLFDNINININTAKDKENITKYPLLCYIIFYFACMLINYNIYTFDDDNKKFSLEKVKIIINTIINILVFITDNINNFIHNNFSYLFYFKLNTLYTDNNILKKIKQIQDTTIKVNKNKNTLYINKKNFITIPLDGKFKQIKILYNPNIKLSKFNFIYIYTNTTLYNNNNLDIKELYNKFLNELNNNIVKHYNIKIKIRQNTLTDNQVKQINKEEYDKIINLYNKIKNKNIYDSYINNNIFINKYNNNINKLQNINILRYNKINLDIFINYLTKLYGSYFYINKKKISIVYDVYKLNFDMNGNYFKNNIDISEKAILIYKTHEFFKQDTYMFPYENYKLYFNLYTNEYIGFKDKDKYYKNTKQRILKVEYSIKNIILLMGFGTKYYNIENEINDNNLYNLLKNRNNKFKNLINYFIKKINISKYTSDSVIYNLYNNNIKFIFNNFLLYYENNKIDYKYNYKLINDKYIDVLDFLENNNTNILIYFYLELIINLISNNKILSEFIKILHSTFNSSIERNNTLNIIFYKKTLLFDEINDYNDSDNINSDYYNEVDTNLTEEEIKNNYNDALDYKESMDSIDVETGDDGDDEVLFKNSDSSFS